MTTSVRQQLESAIAQPSIAALADAVSMCLTSNSEEAVFSELGALQGPGFDVYARLEALTDHELQHGVFCLVPAIAYTPGFSRQQADVCLRFVNRLGPTFRGAIAVPLSKQFQQYPELGRQLGEAILSSSIQGDDALGAWAFAYSLGLPADAASFAVGAIDGSEKALKLAAIVLQHLNCAVEQVASNVRPHARDLETELFELANREPADWHAWNALCAISPCSESTADLLRRVAASGPLAGQVAIGRWLERRKAPVDTAPPTSELLDLLVAASATDAKLRPSIDGTLTLLLRKTATRAAVLGAIAHLRTAELDLSQEYPHFLAGFVRQSSEYAHMLTRWLAADDSNLLAVKGLLSQCILRTAQPAIDVTAFKALSDDEKGRIVKRLCGLAYHGPVLCDFAAVFAESVDLHPEGLEIARQMLNFLFAEFPAATEAFLKEKCRAIARTAPQAPLYRTIYANMLRWRRVLQRLPKLKELRPSDSELFELHRMRARENREILRLASQRSVLAQVATRVNIRQGRRFASHTLQQPPQITEMKSLQHFVELPSSELADPVGGWLRRMQWISRPR